MGWVRGCCCAVFFFRVHGRGGGGRGILGWGKVWGEVGGILGWDGFRELQNQLMLLFKANQTEEHAG